MPDSPNNAPRFFFSYAREDRDKYLDRFFADISKNLAQRGGFSLNDAEAGFRDTKNLQIGDDFDEALSLALKTSRSLICIYTPRYFTREYCGKEFQAFLSRQNVSIDDAGKVRGAKFILPVLWLSESDLLRKGLPPEVLEKIQYVSNVNGEAHRKQGLLGILRKSSRGKYQEIVDCYVNRILELTETGELLPNDSVGDIAGLSNAFDANPGGFEVEPEDQPSLNGPKDMLLVLLSNTSEDTVERIKELVSDDLLPAYCHIQKFDTDDASGAIASLVNAKNSNSLPVLLVDPLLLDDHLNNDFYWQVLRDNRWQGGVFITVDDDGRTNYHIFNDAVRDNYRISQRLVVRESMEMGVLADRLQQFVLVLQQKIMAECPVLRPSSDTSVMVKPILNLGIGE